MGGKLKQLFLLFLIVVPTLGITAFTVYMQGYQQYGSPEEYRQEQEALRQARQDSIRTARNIVTPEAAGDSSMFGLDSHEELVLQQADSTGKIEYVQSTIDSLRQEEQQLTERERILASREEILLGELDIATEERINRLAQLYDNMKADMAVPILIAENDTLAVRIISRMEPRNAARVLGAIAEEDVDKAARLNKLLASMGAH